MACFVLHPKDWEVTIPDYCDVQGVTVYNIKIRIGNVRWFVNHRYKDFADLHDSLVTDHSLSRDILPPKKVIGNRDPNFVEKRRAGLEKYLTYIVNFLQKTMPKKLVYFLNLDKYDIMFLLQSMSAEFFDGGSSILSVTKMYGFNIIQVHAISERIRLPCPPPEIFGLKYDFSNVLEFCSQLETISISGGVPGYEDSNIDSKNMAFELSAFKSLQNLMLHNLDISNLCKANGLRVSLRSLSVLGCKVKNVGEVLLCDELHKDWKTAGEDRQWKNLIEVDLSNNDIEILDGGLALMPSVEGVNLDSNKLFELTNLDALPRLQRLHLSSNRIYQLSSLCLQMKCIKFIDLSQNQITSLKGFENLNTLQGFNLASNAIKDLNEISYVSNLPLLDYIVMTGNPISTIVDYRVKVLEKFGSRYSRICLDNEQSTQKELDTVAVLQALRYVKEGRTPNFGKAF